MTREAIFSFQANAATIRRSAVHSLLLQVLLRLKGVITLPIITYLMLPAELGIFNLLANTAALLAPFLTLNLTDGPVIYFVREQDKNRLSAMYSTVFHTSLITATAGLSLLYILAGTLSPLQDLKPYFAYLVLCYASLQGFKVTSYVLVIYQKTGRMIRYSALNEMGGAILGIFLVWLGWSYKGLILGSFVVAMIIAVWILRLLLQEIDLVPRIDRDELYRFLRVALPLMPVFLFSWVMQSLDSYFLAYYWGMTLVGQYAVVYSICRVILASSMALNFFWYPVSVKMWEEARETYQRYIRLLISYGLPPLLLVLFLFELNSKLIVFVFARNPEYAAASPYLSLIAFAFIMQVFITILTAPLYANENPRWIFLANALGGLLNLGLNFLLIPAWGLWGASVSTALSYFLVGTILTIGIHRFCRFRVLEKRGAVFFVASIGLWAVMMPLRDHISTVSGMVASAVFVSLSVVLYFGSYLTRDERRTVRTWLGHRIRRQPPVVREPGGGPSHDGTGERS